MQLVCWNENRRHSVMEEDTTVERTAERIDADNLYQFSFSSEFLLLIKYKVVQDLADWFLVWMTLSCDRITF